MTPRHPSPLPDSLTGRPFTTGEAFARGVGRGRVRGPDLDRGVYGARSAATGNDWFIARCHLYAARLGGGVFFSHSTAGRIAGVPLPRRLEQLTRIHVTVPAPTRAPHAAGLIGHSRVTPPDDVVVDGSGLRVSAPARLVCELASVLDMPDLVAVIDHLIHHAAPAVTREQLADRIGIRDRISRSKVLRRAIALADERAESRPESLIRVWCVLAGLPRPVANHPTLDPVTGRPLRLDLAWPDLMIAVEYHGDYHRDPAQWRRDLTRKGRLESVGWTIIELHTGDLRDRTALVERIRVALKRPGRR